MGIINKSTINNALKGIKYLIGDTIYIGDDLDIPIDALVSVHQSSEMQEMDGLLLEGDLEATVTLDDLQALIGEAIMGQAILDGVPTNKDLIKYKDITYRIQSISKDPLDATIKLTCNKDR